MKINTVGTRPQKRPVGGGKKQSHKLHLKSPCEVHSSALRERVSLPGHKGALQGDEGGELHAPASSLAELRKAVVVL